MKAYKNGYEFLHAHAKSLAVGGLLLCALGGSPVGAVTTTDGAFERMMTNVTGVGKTTVSFGGTGIPLLSPGVPTLTTDGGLPLASRSGSFANPSGVHVPVGVAARVPSAALASLLKKGAYAVPFLGTGVALYDLFRELGFTVTKPNGDVLVIKNDPTICSVSPCYSYRAHTSMPWVYSATKAAQDWDSANRTNTNNYPFYYLVYTGIVLNAAPTMSVASYNQISRSNGSLVGTTPLSISVQLASPQSANPLPSSMEELEAAIASKSGWPSTSKVAQALAEASTATSDQIQTQSPTVTGPATSTGTTSVTTNPDGTTTTKTTTHNHNYSGPNVTTSNVTVTSIYNPVTNNTTTTTTTESPPKEEDKTSECEKSPDSLGCSEYGEPPSDDVPKTTRTLTYAEESTGLGNGSCPAPQTVATSIGSVTLDLADFCVALETYAKPVIILLAMLTALFIVAPVKTDA